MNNHNNDVKQAIGRRQRANETKRRINNEETVAEYIAARRQVKKNCKTGKTQLRIKHCKNL